MHYDLASLKDSLASYVSPPPTFDEIESAIRRHGTEIVSDPAPRDPNDPDAKPVEVPVYSLQKLTDCIRRGRETNEKTHVFRRNARP
ncbi:MAG TPA: hypothetical protein VIT91_09390 [Chthoniobacterales bacterium]